jgi:hypothetical protein
MLHAYLNLTLEAITNHPSFADQPPEVLGSVLEMFIMRKCHPRTWELSHDPDKDSAMKDRLDSLQWMNFEHLDIKCLSEATLRRGSSSGGGGTGGGGGGGEALDRKQRKHGEHQVYFTAGGPVDCTA